MPGTYWCLLVHTGQELPGLPDYPKVRFGRRAPAPLQQLVPEAGPEALDLLRRFLRYPSGRRIRAPQVGTQWGRGGTQRS